MKQTSGRVEASLDEIVVQALVSQQQLELIAERSQHADEVREKDEELSNLRAQLNQERQK